MEFELNILFSTNNILEILGYNKKDILSYYRQNATGVNKAHNYSEYIYSKDIYLFKDELVIVEYTNGNSTTEILRYNLEDIINKTNQRYLYLQIKDLTIVKQDFENKILSEPLNLEDILVPPIKTNFQADFEKQFSDFKYNLIKLIG